MLFNSTAFLQFLAVFLPCYWAVRRWLVVRNALLVVASYVFYAGWDPRFTILLLASTAVDYGVGRLLGITSRPVLRRLFLAASVGVNLGVLGVFKYLGLAAETAENWLHLLGHSTDWSVPELILPVGISFYTFQSMSYTIDVFRRHVPVERSFLRLATYIAFFPQLVAGPIERANTLLPQFHEVRVIGSADVREGWTWVVRGLFKKVVLADSLGQLVALSMDTPGVPGPVVLLGTVAFGMQIYCDFSGYTDIARGLARWLGFSLSPNFLRPYLATDLRDFWRRWHVSLSTWLRDYLYIPLGGNRSGRLRLTVALLATMILGGLWHGARVNFLLWGWWHGLALCIVHSWQAGWGQRYRIPRPLGWILTMGVVFYGWLFFRAGDMDDLWRWHVALASDWTWPSWGGTFLTQWTLLVLPLFLVEGIASRPAVQCWLSAPKGSQWTLRMGWVGEVLLLVAVVAFWTDEPPEFIYFQF